MQTLQEKYRYNPFLEYGNQLETIISQKQYDSDIADMLRLSFPIMVEYYGHEYKDILFNVLKNVDIEIPKNNENMYDIATKYTPKNIEKRSKISAVSEGELKRAEGVHSVSPVFLIENGQIKLAGKSEVVSVKRTSNKLEMLACFVHELSHAFKSNQKSINFMQNENGENILICRSGISVVYSKVYEENKKVIIEDFKENNIGLEEGINTYDENNIINKILSLPISEVPLSSKSLREELNIPKGKDKYSSSGYVQESTCAEKLLKKCKLEQTVRQDQFLGTNNCEERYNSMTQNSKNSWKDLNLKVDRSVKHTYERYKHIFEPEWFQEHKDEIIGNLKDINSMLEECATNKENICQKNGES